MAQPDPEPAAAWPEGGPARISPPPPPGPVSDVVTGLIHHLEFWVPDLDRAVASWGWLLDELGYKPFGDWPGGRSWRAGHTYIVLEQSPDRTAGRHDRHRPGLNHLAFHVADQELVEKLVAVAPSNGWRLMFPDRHPYAGGDGHYAAYLENIDGFEAELVAPSPVGPGASG
jgi:catechol 2,3-dioxygenase-like lactoylglutathione lyase family enzyme